MTQTKEQRKEKYWLARSFGMNPYWARGMRDWHLSQIERSLNCWQGMKKLSRLPDGTPVVTQF